MHFEVHIVIGKCFSHVLTSVVNRAVVVPVCMCVCVCVCDSGTARDVCSVTRAC